MANLIRYQQSGSVRQDFLGMGRKAPRNILGGRSQPECKPGNKRCGGACVPAFRNGQKTLCKDEVELAQKRSLSGRAKQAGQLLAGVRAELRERLRPAKARKKASDDREIDAELKSMKRAMAQGRAQQARNWRSSGSDEDLEKGLVDVGKRRKARRNREYIEAELEFMKRGGYDRPGNLQTVSPAQSKPKGPNQKPSGGSGQGTPPKGLPRNYTPTADAKILGVSEADLKGMDRRGLRQLRRSLAAKYHPDKGGTQEQMQAVNAAFDNLTKFLRLDSAEMRLWVSVREGVERWG